MAGRYADTPLIECDPQHASVSAAAAATTGRAALATLYEATAAQVFGLVNAILCDTAAAEDVTVQVYRDAWNAIADGDSPAPGAGAQVRLLADAHRHAADYLRSHHDDDAEDPRQTVAPRASLDRLDEPSRELFVLMYYRGHTCRQAANLLGLPVATAQSQIRAALRRLAPPSQNP
jgi:RNA polymerase sigma-70 factor, ECF subfamily